MKEFWKEKREYLMELFKNKDQLSKSQYKNLNNKQTQIKNSEIINFGSNLILILLNGKNCKNV